MSGMPRIETQHENLARMGGDWTGEEIVHPSPWDPAGGPARGKMRTRVSLDGFFVISDYEQTRGEQVTYRGHGVYGWDAARESYTMHWFDSMGGGFGEPARGTWAGKTLTFRLQSPMGHARYVYDFDADDRYRFRIETSPDGTAWAPFLEGTYTRTSR